MNHFISMAIAEKVSRLEQAEWLRTRNKEALDKKPLNTSNGQQLPIRK